MLLTAILVVFSPYMYFIWFLTSFLWKFFFIAMLFGRKICSHKLLMCHNSEVVNAQLRGCRKKITFLRPDNYDHAPTLDH